MNEVTCLRVSRATRDKLAKKESKDQTFDQIVNELIEELAGKNNE